MSIVVFLFLIIAFLLHVIALSHIIYMIFKTKTKFNCFWIWIVILIPIIGPIIYFNSKKIK